MSVSLLTHPEVQGQVWANLYMNQVHADVAEVKDITVDNVTVDTLDVTNLDVAGNAIISGVNFASIGSVGISGQVLTSQGDGSVLWVTNGSGSGDVVGPVSSVGGNLSSFGDNTGKLLADSGIAILDVMTNNAQIEANAQVVNNMNSAVFRDLGIVALQPLANSHKLYLDQVDQKFHSLSDLGVDHALATEGLDANFNDLSAVGLEIDGGSFSLNNSGPGDQYINFQASGLPTKYLGVDNGTNVMHIKNSANADILTMDDSKNSEFFGDLKVDGVLNPGSNWANLPNTDIIWRAGAATSKNVLGSWSEVVFYANANNQAVNIYVDDSLNPCIMTSNYDCMGRTVFYPYTQNIGTVPALKFAVDVQLTDPTFKGVLQIVGLTSANSNIILSNNYLMGLFQGGLLSNDAASLLPIIDIAPGSGAIVACYIGSTINTNNAVSIINVGVGSTLILAQFSMSQPLGNDIISSTDGTANLILQCDASFTNPFTNVGYTGATVSQFIDKAVGVVYDDSVSPALGSTDVQGALDALKVRAPSGYTLSYGGSLDSFTGFYAVVNGPANYIAPSVTNTPLTIAIVPISGTITKLTYNTALGDVTTNIAVNLNNVETGFFLTAASGSQVLSLPVAAGDTLGIDFVSGTDPTDSNFVIYIEVQ